MVKAVAEPDASEHLTGVRAVGAARAERHPEQHVLQHREALQQIEGLEDVAQLLRAQAVAAGLAQRRHLDAVNRHHAGIGGKDARHQVEKGRLARTALAAQRELFPCPEPELRDVDHLHGSALWSDEGLGEVRDRKHRANQSRPRGKSKCLFSQTRRVQRRHRDVPPVPASARRRMAAFACGSCRVRTALRQGPPPGRKSADHDGNRSFDCHHTSRPPANVSPAPTLQKMMRSPSAKIPSSAAQPRAIETLAALVFPYLEMVTTNLS